MSDVEVIQLGNDGEVIAVEIDEYVIVSGVQIPSNGGATKLDELTDVEDADIGLAGQVLQKQLDGMWRPGNVSGGGGDTGLVFTQLAPAASWTIPHNLGRFPQVTAVDTDGNRIWPDLHYDSNNAVTLVHAAPLAGAAYLI